MNILNLIFRLRTTPSSSIFPPNYQSWTPTTPTPGSALRPSLSLHNLASKTFTEVLIPSIKPPDTHSASPKSPVVVWSSQDVTKKISIVNFVELKSYQQTSANENLPNMPRKSFSKLPKPLKSSENQQPPQSPSPPSINLRTFTSLSSLAKISENLTFIECKKEISV